MERDIQAVLFDFGQTLVDSADGFRAAEKIAKQDLFRDMRAKGADFDWKAFVARYRKIRKAFHARSQLSRPDIWQAVYDAFGIEADASRLLDWERDYWQTVKSRTKPFPETAGVLEDLSQTCRLALVTNTQGQKSGGTHRSALFPGIERFFEVIVVAGEGAVPPKPDPRAFQAALDAMNILPAEAVYVGDDWRNDVCGARDAGLQPVWLKHHSVRRNWPPGSGDVPVIHALGELVYLLADWRRFPDGKILL